MKDKNNPYKQPELDSDIKNIISKISKSTSLSEYDVQQVLKVYFDIYQESVFDSSKKIERYATS
jgi:hypothetical protein